MMPILILHGPNLNLLGEREVAIYGEKKLEEINNLLIEAGVKLGLEVRCFQSNIEGVLIDYLHEARNWAKGILLNPGGYTHTSVAIRDAVSAIKIPVIEIHLSNIHAREDFRKQSMIAPACIGSISGFGWKSYLIGLYALNQLFEQK